MAWVKASSPGSGYRGIITKQGNYGLFIRDGVLASYDWGNNQNITTNINIADDSWKHVAMTFTTNTGTPSNNAIIYLNGSAVLTTTIKYSVDTVGLQIGNGGDAVQYISGNIAGASLYNRPLSAAEVLQNYNAQKSRYVASFDADAQAFITAAGITDSTQQSAINQLVLGLKTDSLWATLDAIYPFVGGTATNHKWNLKDPRDLDVAYRLQFNGGMTHSTNGILFNGTNGWADTSGYNFMIDYFGCYTRNSSDNGKDYMGSQSSELIDDGDGPYFVFINGFQLSRDSFILSSRSGFGATNNIISTGLSVVTKKISSGQSVYYKNGIQRGTANNPVNTSVAYPPIAIGALNPNSDLSAGTSSDDGYSNQQIAFAFIGNSELNATQNTNLYNRVQTFQTSLSRQV